MSFFVCSLGFIDKEWGIYCLLDFLFNVVLQQVIYCDREELLLVYILNVILYLVFKCVFDSLFQFKKLQI